MVQSRSMLCLSERTRRMCGQDGSSWLFFQAFHKLAARGQRNSGELVTNQDFRPGSTRELLEKSGPGTMARCLVKKVMGLSNVKEEVYGALDEWAAFELEFPIVATRKALERLRRAEEWHRVIQVSKWMMSKGVGKTHGTYSLLLKAYCMEGRLEDAEALWDKLLSSHGRSMPKSMFAYITNVYRKQEMPEKILKVFEQMESFGIKPDVDLLRRVKEAYEKLGITEKQELLARKYALDSDTRKKEKRRIKRQALKASKSEMKSVQTDGDCNIASKTVKQKIEIKTKLFGERPHGRILAGSNEGKVGIQMERGYNTDSPAEDDNDDDDNVENVLLQGNIKRVHMSQTAASFSTCEVGACSKGKQRRQETNSSSRVDDEFVKNIIATM